MRVLIRSCEQCGSILSCVSVGSGNQNVCHQCKKCIHEIPKLQKEGRIIPSGICFSCREKAKYGDYKKVV